MSQVSTVHDSPSSQSPPSTQQLVMDGLEQVWVATSHRSAVQTAPSAHSASKLQQPATGTGALQVLVARSQLSAVQMSPSEQSASLEQQPAMGVKSHRDVTGLQLSAVHSLPSLQSESRLQ